LLTGCASPPQILEISPLQGATSVPSNAPVRIGFDRAMDRASVASQFRLEPPVRGSVHWTNSRQMRFDHQPFMPSTKYQVILSGGYRDAQGQANSLRHSWIFSTESSPELAGSSPSDGERGVDTAAYIALTFSREMDTSTLPQAMSISPSVRFRIERDPADPHRVIVVPEALLTPNQEYSITVTTRARDVDGNRLGTGSAVTFMTGPQHGLQHWIGFVAQRPAGGAGRSPGVWIVDESRFPRVLVPATASWFAWSPDGQRLLLRSSAGSWSDETVKGTSTPLPFQGTWAGYLAGGRGYAYLDGTDLYTMAPGGPSKLVTNGVTNAALDPGGTRIAFTVATGAGAELHAYDIGLNTDYRLQTESRPIDGLAWSPDGLSLAYRLGGGSSTKHQIRVRLLRDRGSTVTVATGDVGVPVWQADSRHVFFTATVKTSSGPAAKLFRFAAGEPPPSSLTAAAGIPTSSGVSVGDPSASPDGRQVAFISQSRSSGPEVWLMNADGTGLTQLTAFNSEDFPYQCYQVSWTSS
jgi:dipeptidyl aminopeptidase/acylaminoacyl peptidase